MGLTERNHRIRGGSRMCHTLQCNVSSWRQKSIWQNIEIVTHFRTYKSAVRLIRDNHLVGRSDEWLKDSLKIEKNFIIISSSYENPDCYLPVELYWLGFHSNIFGEWHIRYNVKGIHPIGDWKAIFRWKQENTPKFYDFLKAVTFAMNAKIYGYRYYSLHYIEMSIV